MLSEFMVAISLCALIVSIASLVMALICVVEIKAIQKSTHQITYLPLDEAPKTDKELNKELFGQPVGPDSIADDLDNI